MPMDADFEYGTAEKDLGFVWGPSLGGEDIMDVPYEVTVNVKQLPATTGNITLKYLWCKLMIARTQRQQVMQNLEPKPEMIMAINMHLSILQSRANPTHSISI